MIETCTDISECLAVYKIMHAPQSIDHLNALTVYMINGWPSTRADVKEIIQNICYSYDNVVIEGRVKNHSISFITTKGPWAHKQQPQKHKKKWDYWEENPYKGSTLILILKMPCKIAQYVLNFRQQNQKTNWYNMTYQTSHRKLDVDIFMLNSKDTCLL